MDQPTYTNLTGYTPTATQIARFEVVAEMTKKLLEDILGWPLDPTDWENQYLEIGKTPNENDSCLNVDTESLLDPDAVVGSYRLYKWNGSDQFIHIDPATQVNAVKLVRDGITCRTFDVDDGYTLQWVNGNPKYVRYLKLCKDCLCGCVELTPTEDCRMIAVDADWLFEPMENGESTLPIQLQKVWADMMVDEFDARKNIKSESLTSHSYTKFDRQTIEQKHGSILKLYVGPNGSFKRPRIV